MATHINHYHPPDPTMPQSVLPSQGISAPLPIWGQAPRNTGVFGKGAGRTEGSTGLKKARAGL